LSRRVLEDYIHHPRLNYRKTSLSFIKKHENLIIYFLSVPCQPVRNTEKRQRNDWY